MDQNYPVSPQPAQPPYTPASPPPVWQPAPPKPRIPSDRRDIVMAAVLIVLSVLAVNFSLYGGFAVGYAVSFLALLVCEGIYLRRRMRRVTAYGVFCTVAAATAAGLFVWHNDGVIHFFAFCGMILLAMLALLEGTDTATRDGGTTAALLDVGHLLLVRPFAHMGTAISSIFLVKQGETVGKRRCGGALLGMLCALPVLLAVVPLLISADAAFEGLLRHTVLDRLGEVFVSLLLGVPLFCLIYSRLFGLRHELPDKAKTPAPPANGVGAIGINTFLITIGSVYVLYLLSQLAYFFSAFSGILPKEYTVAQYARRGFFEMAAICTINLGMVGICLWLSRKQDGKAPLSTRLVTLFILLFSIGLVATALSKMVLYIRSFGMTRLRILTAVFMVMLAAVLAFVILRLFITRFPYMKATVIAVALMGLTVGYVDVDTVIAQYNITAYESGALERLDLDTLSDLSDGATPYLVELWDARTPQNEKRLAAVLYQRLEAFGDITYEENKHVYEMTEDMDFRHYNVDLFRARRLLAERAQEICDVLFDSSDYSEIYGDYTW